MRRGRRVDPRTFDSDRHLPSVWLQDPAKRTPPRRWHQHPMPEVRSRNAVHHAQGDLHVVGGQGWALVRKCPI
jgi:hypothetical protein